MRPLALVPVALALLAPAARADGVYNVDQAQSRLSYKLIHKMHTVEGVSKKVEGKAIVAPDGKAQVGVRAPVASFDSGNVNRDAHMKEAVAAAQFPYVEVKAIGDGKPPASFPATEKRTFKLQLVFHGEKKLFDIPVELIWKSADEVQAKANFRISLEGYQVERPSLMFVKVEDGLDITADLVFKK
jgi:polyisoprenoid-binding protein YceI